MVAVAGPDHDALPSGSSSPALSGSPTSKRENQPRSSLSKAMAKAELQKQLAQQRAAELKVASEWNELFKSKDNVRNPDYQERFWAEVKVRLQKKFGSIPLAFRALDSSGDGSLNLLEFSDMLSQINLAMDQRVVRNVFDRASGSDRSLSLEEMKTMLLDKTIKKLKFVMEGFNGKQERVQCHIHRLIRRLALCDEANQVRSIDRFQRKLTVKFCTEIWQALQKKAGGTESAVDQDAFAEVMARFVTKEEGTRLLVYEIQFMQRIFEKVDRRGRGVVYPNEFAATVILLSMDRDRVSKAAAAFDFFDADGDGCLLYEEILQLCLCLCQQRMIAEQNLRSHHQLEFQEELSIQEGRRAYELALWHLQRTTKVEGGIVSKHEFVEALEEMDHLLNCLVPGAVHLRWALEPSAREGPDPPSPPWPLKVASAGPPPAPQPGTSVVTSRRSLAVRKSLHVGQAISAMTNTNVISGDEVISAPKFKRAQEHRFKQSLRGWGDVRLAELTAGFIVPPEVKEADAGSSDDGGSNAGAPGSGGPGLSRSASAPTMAAPGGGGSRGARSLGHSRSSKGNKHRRLIDLTGCGTVDEVPPVFAEKWGAESADRFRLFAAVTIGSGRIPGEKVNLGENLKYKCNVCLRFHRFGSSPDCEK